MLSPKPCFNCSDNDCNHKKNNMNITKEELIEIFNTKVKEKYKNEYFRKLVIFFHLDELKLKKDRLISEDKEPLKDSTFIKELADMKILLDFLVENDNEFKELVEKRILRFSEHTYKELTNK